MTRSGKTILGDNLRNNWLKTWPRGRCLIVDSKPHYRAQWDLSGLSAARHYKKQALDEHDFVPGSYRIPLDGHYRESLKAAFKKSRVVIVQGGRKDWGELLICAQTFYDSFSAKSGPRLLQIDEGADFFEIDRWGGIILQALRAGGQLKIGVMLGSQRPKFIPKSVLTESDRIYLFKLKNIDDLKAIQAEGGLPKSVTQPERFYEFTYWNFYEDPDQANGKLFTLGGIS